MRRKEGGETLPRRRSGLPKAEGAFLLRALLVVAAFYGLLRAFSPEGFDIAFLMARVDLFAFGGAYTSIPLLLHEVVEVRGWMDERMFMDAIALGQITPGPIVITSTCVGYIAAGLSGALAATAGMFTPSFLVLVASAPFLERIRGNAAVRAFLGGVLSAFVGLLAAVGFRFALSVSWSVPAALLAAGAVAGLLRGLGLGWIVGAGILTGLLAR